jgi:hypothetical protein
MGRRARQCAEAERLRAGGYGRIIADWLAAAPGNAGAIDKGDTMPAPVR